MRENKGLVFKLFTDRAYVAKVLEIDHLDASDYDARQIKIRIERRRMQYEAAARFGKRVA